jgi:hypothetical protein
VATEIPKNHKKRNDAILIAALLLAAGILFLATGAAKKDGAQVCVYVDGARAASYSLFENREIPLAYDGHNTLKIEAGAASVTDADCPDRLCVKQRAISKQGETIVCLPHRLIVKIEGGDAPDVDGVVR